MKRFYLFMMVLLVVSAYAATPNPGHDASRIGAGTFSSGNYVFPANLDVSGNLVIDTNVTIAGTRIENNNVNIRYVKWGGSPGVNTSGRWINVANFTISGASNRHFTINGEIVGATYHGFQTGDTQQIFVSIRKTSSGLEASSRRVFLTAPMSGTTDQYPFKNISLVLRNTSGSGDSAVGEYELWLQMGRNWITEPQIRLSWATNTGGTYSFLDGNAEHQPDITAGYNTTYETNSYDNVRERLYFNSDEYLYRPAADSIGVSGSFTVANNLGVGTISPTQKLDVNGSVNISGASGILYVPQICLNGDCQTSWPSPSGASSAGGWTNTTVQTSTSLNVSIDSGVLFVDSTNNRVGVGTTGPSYTLDVSGSLAVGNNTIHLNPSGALTDVNNISITAGRAVFGYDGIRNSAVIQGGAGKNIVFDSNAAERIRILSSGAVGINNTNPTSTLHVTGTANVTSTLFAGSTITGASGLTIQAGTVSLPTGQIQSTEIADSTIDEIDLNVSGTPAAGQLLAYNSTSGGFYWATDAGGTVDGAGAANRAAFWTDADTLSSDGNFTWDNTQKRLGIGTTGPTASLEVSGAANNTNRTYINLDGQTHAPDLTFKVGSDGLLHNGAAINVIAYGRGTGVEDLRFETSNWGGSHTWAFNSANGTPSTYKVVGELTTSGSGAAGSLQHGRFTLYSVNDSQGGYSGGAGAGAVNVRLSANGDSWLTGGDVGIGTASPNVNLTVGTPSGNTANTIASFWNDNETVVKILSNANVNGNGSHLHLMENNGNLYGIDIWYDTGNNRLEIDSYQNSVKTDVLSATTTGAVTLSNGLTVSSGSVDFPANSIPGDDIADGSIDASELEDAGIMEVDLNASNAPTDNYVLTYNSATGGFTWDADQTGIGSSTAAGWTNTSILVSLSDSNDNISAGAFFVDNSNGRVGIGTTVPLTQFSTAGQMHLFGQGRNLAGNDVNLVFGDYPSGNWEQLYWQNGAGAFTFTDDLIADTIQTGQGTTEVYMMNQNVQSTDAVTFATVNTGQGANELYDMDQNVLTTSAVSFVTVNTGQGANELYDMNQNVQTTDSPTFASLTLSGNLTVSDEAVTYNGVSYRYGVLGSSNMSSGDSSGKWILLANVTVSGDYDTDTLTLDIFPYLKEHGTTRQTAIVRVRNTAGAAQTPAVYLKSWNSIGAASNRALQNITVVHVSGAGSTNNVYEVWGQVGASWLSNVPIQWQLYSIESTDAVSVTNQLQWNSIPTSGIASYSVNDWDLVRDRLYVGEAGDVYLYRSAANVLHTPDGFTSDAAITGATLNTGSGAMELGDAAVANGDTNSIPTSDQVYDFVIAQSYITDDTNVSKNHLNNAGTLGFDWVDSEIADALTVSSGTIGSNTISAGSAWTLGSTLNLDSNTLYVDGSNNRVGVGTASPPGLFTVAGGSANWDQTTPGTTVGSIHIDPESTTDHYGGALTFGASDSGNGESAQAGIYVRSDGSYGTKMYFATTDAYVSGSKTRMYISEGGRVGIGTTSPANQLHVYGGHARLEYSNVNNAQYGFLNSIDGLHLMENAYYDGAWKSIEGGHAAAVFQTSLANNYAFAVSYDPSVSAADEALSLGAAFVVKTDGNTGIGTTSPNASLDIIKPSSSNVYDAFRVNRPDAQGQYAFVGYGPSSSAGYFGSVYTGSAGVYGSIHLRQYTQGMTGRNGLSIDESGNTSLYGNLYVDQGSGSGDSYIYMDAGAESIRWEDASTWFEFSDKIRLSDELQATRMLDNDNTNYLVDPAGTSVFNALTLGGGTAWHSSNDGAGSGLDADVLDGLSSGSFVRTDARSSIALTGRTTAYSVSNLELYTSDNTPPGLAFHRGGVSATNLYESGGELYVNAWDGNGGGIVWTGGIDGAGSGLDADLVDGNAVVYNNAASDFNVATNSDDSPGYSTASLELREAQFGGSAAYDPPHLSFHWGGVVASQFTIESSGRLVAVNNPGTSYENFGAADLYALGSDIYISDSNTRLTESTGNSLRIQTDSGYIDIGAMNAGYAHLQTDRGQFYFSNEVIIDEGKVSSYDEDLYLQRAGSTKIQATATDVIVTVG